MPVIIYRRIKWDLRPNQLLKVPRKKRAKQNTPKRVVDPADHPMYGEAQKFMAGERDRGRYTALRNAKQLEKWLYKEVKDEQQRSHPTYSYKHFHGADRHGYQYAAGIWNERRHFVNHLMPVVQWEPHNANLSGSLQHFDTRRYGSARLDFPFATGKWRKQLIFK